MYAGALLWIVSVGGFLAYNLGLVLGVWALMKRGLAAILKAVVIKIWKPLVRSARNCGKMCAKIWRDCASALRRFGTACRRRRRSLILFLHFWKKHSPADQDGEQNHNLPESVSELSNEKAASEAIAVIAEVQDAFSTEDILATMGLNRRKLKTITFTPIFMLLPFIGQWLFWAGFVRLAREL